MQQEKISIIMGIYNCAKTLPESIDSIIAQTYQNWELIMCDDCSTDNTYAIAKEYQKKYPDKIILIRNETNSRLAFSLNHCLEYATGKYIARMDADDLSQPERFEKQIDFLRGNPDVNLVGTAMQRFNDKGLHDIVHSVKNPNRYTLRGAIPFHHATIITYKYVYDTLDGYTVSERTNRAQDYDLWFKFYHAEFKGENLPDALYLVREDKNAVRRRTFKARFNAFKTTCIGFRLLKFPKYWIIKPFLLMIFKSLTPFFIIDLYRLYQSKKNNF